MVTAVTMCLDTFYFIEKVKDQRIKKPGRVSKIYLLQTCPLRYETWFITIFNTLNVFTIFANCSEDEKMHWSRKALIHSTFC